jgi:hypothetical protein
VIPPPLLLLQAHFPRGSWDRLDHMPVSGVYFEFQITDYNGKEMMGPYDMYIYTTGMSSPSANIELLLAVKGSDIPDLPWNPDDKPPPVPITRDGFYAIISGGSFYQFKILPIIGHRYSATMEYDDHSFTTYTLTDLTYGVKETWGTYLLSWSDDLKSFGTAEENHIKVPCFDTECDNIDIQPYDIGPYSVETTGIAIRPIWKARYKPLSEICTQPSCYHNINLNYLCLYQGDPSIEMECSKRQKIRYSNTIY